ncbi:MAG TPA: pentapeptide repeat-containing protein, partial [Polyangiaceae bacterium]|nr:pentapeptide repeat-containing protein [Polyangiaceae bacterium]
PAVEVLDWLRRQSSFEIRFRLDELTGALELADPEAIAAIAELVRASGEGWPQHWRRRAASAFAAPSDEQALRARLSARSLPRTTSAAVLLACLEERGVTGRSAQALLDWLGGDAALLFESTASAEGRRQQELRARARAASEEDPSTVRREIVRELSAGEPLDKASFARVLAEHAAFLEANGAGGRFELTVEGGLPVARYSKTEPPGQAQLAFCQLTGLKCSGARLPFADLTGVRAESTSFARAELVGSQFAYARLQRSTFSDATLKGANFTGAQLAEADFRRADLTDVTFDRADLRGANFAGAITSGTRFGGADVRGIKY